MERKMAEELVAQEDADLNAQCIDRWNDEGGSMAYRTKSEVTVSTYGFATPTVAEPAALICRTFAEEEKIRKCLGAAVTAKWETLPAKTPRELPEHATSFVQLMDTLSFCMTTRVVLFKSVCCLHPA
jgi:hypothetical protein